MKDDDEIAARWEHPGMRIQFEYRGDEFWCIEETAYNVSMLLMDEYHKTVRYCIEHGLPLPQPPTEFASQDETIVAIRISESFVRMLTPAEIALRSRNQPMSDE
jgi:hypothetical protein